MAHPFDGSTGAAAATARAKPLPDEVRRRVAHDVRASLNTISGWAEIVRQTTTDEATRLRAVETILRHVRQASRRLDEALDLWRVDVGQMVLAPVPLHVPSLLRAAMSHVDATTPGTSWHLTIDSEDRYTLADAARTNQALVALLAHSAAHAPTASAVRVKVDGQPDQIAIRVEDDGPPMLPDVAAMIFGGPPQAVTVAAGRRFDAGLIFAREVLALQHATLELVSAEGGPHILQVGLPYLTGASPTPWSDDAAVPPRSHLRGVHVLVVDDEDDAREALEGILRYHGAVVHAARTVAQALHTVESTSIDVVVADIAMPGRDGYDLIRSIREGRGRSASVPAAAVTALTGEADRARALDAGFQVHMAKPVQPEQLLATVRRLVPARR
jgi:CheY-like chemotaxis protein